MPIQKVDLTDANASEDWKWIRLFFGIPLVAIGAVVVIFVLLVR